MTVRASGIKIPCSALVGLLLLSLFSNDMEHRASSLRQMSFLSNFICCIPRVLLSIRPDPRADWEISLGVLVRNLQTMRVVYWVNVSESSGAGSHRL